MLFTSCLYTIQRLRAPGELAARQIQWLLKYLNTSPQICELCSNIQHLVLPFDDFMLNYCFPYSAFRGPVLLRSKLYTTLRSPVCIIVVTYGTRQTSRSHACGYRPLFLPLVERSGADGAKRFYGVTKNAS